MDENLFKQLIAELIEAQGEALGLVVSALCQQVDPARLTADLRETLTSATLPPSASPLAIRIATKALGAAEGMKLYQAMQPIEGFHPTQS